MNAISEMNEAYRGIKSDYAAAIPNRFRRIRTSLYGTGDAHSYNRFQFNQLREYARDMERNDSVVKAMLDRAVEWALQTGFHAEPTTPDNGLNAEVKERYHDWWDDEQACDLQGEHSGWEMERLVYRQALIDGDNFVLPIQDGSLQLLEGDRCQSAMEKWATSANGVVLDDNRRRVEYWFTKDSRNNHLIRFADLTRVPAYDEDGCKQVFQIYNPMRSTQSRGVTALHPVFDILGMFEDVNFAVLVQRQMVSMIGLFLERSVPGPVTDLKLGERQADQLTDSSGRIVEGLSPGLIARLPYGYKATTLNAQVPNAEFFPHVKLLLQLVGINLGLPLVIVLMDGSETNFSGWRGAMNQAQMGFRCNQKWLRTKFHRQVYLSKLRQWLAMPAAAGGLGPAARKLGAGLFRHKWNVPGFPYVQPKDDAEADAFRVAHGHASPRMIAAERGHDQDRIVVETVEDNGKAILAAIAKAKEIKAQTGETVSWRDVLNWALPTGITIKTGDGGPENPGSPSPAMSPAPTGPANPDDPDPDPDDEEDDDDK